MAKSEKEIFEEKLALIYGYNNATPLFVRAASQAIARENFSKALEILKNGLKIYPKYSTAYILLGRVYAFAGKYDLAEDALRKGCGLINSPETLNFYISELENIKSKNTNFTESRRVAFFQDELKEMIEKEDSLTPDTEPEKSQNNSEPIDDLEAIARKISSARMTPAAPPKGPEATLPMTEPKENPKEEIISETLAKIYISQGNFKEALIVYEKLLKKQPEKKDLYLTRIEEIRSSLRDMDW